MSYTNPSGLENIGDLLNPYELGIAYDHIEGKNSKTPLLPFGTIHSDGYGVNLWAKMDTLNPGGSFKNRGSEYFVHKAVVFGVLKEDDVVVTASAGNHAKGVARTARDHGLRAIIFMSSNTPELKVGDTRRLGADVILVDGSYNDADVFAREFSSERGYVYIPAYKHPDIIIGQSTVVTEALMQLYWLNVIPDFFVFPFGGGGLANGGGFALNNNQSLTDRKTYVYGVQAENFNTMVRSFREGRIVDYVYKSDTVADGIRVPHASEEMLKLSLRFIDDMFDVTEEQIRDAIRRVYNSELLARLIGLPEEELRTNHGFCEGHIRQISKMNRVEGAAAAAFACAFAEDKIPYDDIARGVYPRREINGVIIASGNNIDPVLLEEILDEK